MMQGSPTLYLDVEFTGDALGEADVTALVDLIARFAADRGLAEGALTCGLRNDVAEILAGGAIGSAAVFETAGCKFESCPVSHSRTTGTGRSLGARR